MRAAVNEVPATQWYFPACVSRPAMFPVGDSACTTIGAMEAFRAERRDAASRSLTAARRPMGKKAPGARGRRQRLPVILMNPR